MLNKSGFFTPLVLLLAVGTGAFMSVILLKLSLVADDAVDMMIQDKFISAINLLSDLREGETLTNHQYKVCENDLNCDQPDLELIIESNDALTENMNSVLYPSNTDQDHPNIPLTHNSILVFPENESHKSASTPTPDVDHLENFKSIILSTNSPKECRLFMSSFNDYHDIGFISDNTTPYIISTPYDETKSVGYPSTSTGSLRQLCSINLNEYLWIKLEL